MLSNYTTSELTGPISSFHSGPNFGDGNQEKDLMPWDTSDPFFTASDRIIMRRVLKCYVRQAVVIVGIPGNLMCCVVFFKQGLSDKINLLLFWLAVADLGGLLSQELLMPSCYLADRIARDNWTMLVNAKLNYVSWWLGHLSGLLVVVVSLHRCLSVVFPFKAKRLVRYRSTTMAIALSYGVSLIVFLPSFLAFTVKYANDSSTNRSIAYMAESTWFPLDSTLAVDIAYYCLAVALPILLCIMIVCCTITILNLRQASRQRLKMTGKVTEESKAGQNRITVMLMVICGAYIALALPDTVFAVLVVLVPGLHIHGKYHNTNIVIYQFMWIFTCLNSTINFFVYSLLSSRFQKTLRSCFMLFSRAH